MACADSEITVKINGDASGLLEAIRRVEEALARLTLSETLRELERCTTSLNEATAEARRLAEGLGGPQG